MKTSIFALLVTAFVLTACGGGGGGSTDSSGPDKSPDSSNTEVIGGTTARFDTAGLEFGIAAIGTVKARTVVLHNDGDVEADFHEMSGLPSGFTTTGCEAVPAGGSCELRVLFRPLGVGIRSSAEVAPMRADVVSNRLFVRGTGVFACPGTPGGPTICP